MPVRSSNSSVLTWPDRAAVDAAARAWARAAAKQHPDLRRVGYFGSYARGDWGVGSDLDLVAIVAASPRPPHERALDFDPSRLPVPAELLVYTAGEWQAMQQAGGRFAERLQAETVWVYPDA